jgi:hypothetical protein
VAESVLTNQEKPTLRIASPQAVNLPHLLGLKEEPVLDECFLSLTRRLALSKSAVNHYLRATMVFK